MRDPVLAYEERVAVMRRRLNERTVGMPATREAIREFALNGIDVLDGGFGTLTPEERERVAYMRRMPK